MAKIIIRRKKSFVGSVQNHDVYFLNTHVGVLKSGGELEVPVEVGKHIISFNSQMKKMGKNATFTAVVNTEDEIVELQTRFDANGNYVVEYADSKPHIPTFAESSDGVHKKEEFVNNEMNAESKIHTQKSASFCCPKCGSNDLLATTETSTKGKDFNASDACCGWLLCGPIGVLCGAMGKGKQTNSTTYWLCKGCGNKFKA